MVTLDGVVPELRRRIEGVMAESVEKLQGSGRCFEIESALRSREKQAQLHAQWVEGLDKYGTRQKAMLHGYTPANAPGTSKHEIGEAVDIACDARDQALRAGLFGKWGLATPIPDEKWHAELPPGTPHEIQHAAPVQAQEEDEVPQPTDIVDSAVAPNGGLWKLQADGGVITDKGAPFFGSYPALREGPRRFVSIETTADGYVTVDVEGAPYWWNQQVHDDLAAKGLL